MTRTVNSRLTFLLLLWISLSFCRAQDDATTRTVVIGADTTSVVVEEDNDIITISSSNSPRQKFVPDDCTLVMARSSIPNAGWGVFTLTERRKNEPLLLRQQDTLPYGDLVIQIPDLQHPLDAKKLLWEYLWDAAETGGQYEGLNTVSFAPGIAMLTNGDATHFNVLPALQPWMDNAGVTRASSSPGVGAFTHYHNFTWYVAKDMVAGDEILVNYGPGWFQERGFNASVPPHERLPRHTLSKLRQDGYCLDNLHPGPSTIPHAGRGAFANRSMKNGSVVAPVPVLPVSTKSMTMIKQHQDGRWIETQQLLTNYCYGNSQSTVMLCPYSDMVHLINHGGASNSNSNNATQTANVQLQWSTTHGLQYFDRPLEQLQETSTRLLLELVAIRDIEKGEEILLDYGTEWQSAWVQHVDQWNALEESTAAHVPSFALNQQSANTAIRTMAEQKMDPYPDNIFTSCYHKVNVEEILSQIPPDGGQPTKIMAEWKHSKGIYEPRHMRPCLVLDRSSGDMGRDDSFYTVRLMNRPGLKEADRIPKAVAYIVTQVPRKAIQFNDKLYTTDQHLESAFRHPIGLEVFPSEWMDLLLNEP